MRYRVAHLLSYTSKPRREICGVYLIMGNAKGPSGYPDKPDQIAAIAPAYNYGAVGVGSASGVGVGAAPRRTSPKISLSPTASVICALPLDVMVKL